MDQWLEHWTLGKLREKQAYQVVGLIPPKFYRKTIYTDFKFHKGFVIKKMFQQLSD